MKKILVAVVALVGFAVEAAPILLDESEGLMWTTEEETGEEGPGFEMVAPQGLPPGALPSPDGGFVIDPEYIALPEVGGYQWISQESYEADWLVFMLASNARLTTDPGTGEEEGVFEFPTSTVDLPQLSEIEEAAAADEAVPEPSSLISIVTGGALLLLTQKRRAKR